MVCDKSVDDFACCLCFVRLFVFCGIIDKSRVLGEKFAREKQNMKFS